MSEKQDEKIQEEYFMNGIFKLGLVGEMESLYQSFRYSQEHLGKEVLEPGQCAKGVQPFGKTNKLILESKGECAIEGIEEFFIHLCQQFPELEGVLLLHNTDCYTDYDDDDIWMLFYSPAGKGENIIGNGMLGRKEPGYPSDWGEFVEYRSRDEIDVDDVLQALNSWEHCFTREAVAYYIARAFGEEEGEPPEGVCEEGDLDFELDDYIAERGYSAFHRYIGRDAGLPSIEYLAELFSGCRGLLFPN